MLLPEQLFVVVHQTFDGNICLLVLLDQLSLEVLGLSFHASLCLLREPLVQRPRFLKLSYSGKVSKPEKPFPYLFDLLEHLLNLYHQQLHFQNQPNLNQLTIEVRLFCHNLKVQAMQLVHLAG